VLYTNSGGTLFITPDGRTVDYTRWSEILVEPRDFSYLTFIRRPVRSPCRNIAMRFGMEKLVRCGYSFTRLLVLTHHTKRQTARRTDGHTDTARRHRPRLCIASRGKKTNTNYTNSDCAQDRLTEPSAKALAIKKLHYPILIQYSAAAAGVRSEDANQ